MNFDEKETELLFEAIAMLRKKLGTTEDIRISVGKSMYDPNDFRPFRVVTINDQDVKVYVKVGK